MTDWKEGLQEDFYQKYKSYNKEKLLNKVIDLEMEINDLRARLQCAYHDTRILKAKYLPATRAIKELSNIINKDMYLNTLALD